MKTNLGNILRYAQNAKPGKRIKHRKLNTELPYNPPILLLHKCPKEEKAGTEQISVHPCINDQKHNNQKVEATHLGFINE